MFTITANMPVCGCEWVTVTYVNRANAHARTVFRVEALATPTPGAFDEEFERRSVEQQLFGVLGKDGPVQRIVLERASNEERAAVAKDPIDNYDRQKVCVQGRPRLVVRQVGCLGAAPGRPADQRLLSPSPAAICGNGMEYS